MKKSLFTIVLFLSIGLLFGAKTLLGQDQIILNDSVRVDCKIISINNNILQYQNHYSLKTGMVNADTIKGYIYQNKTYINSPKKNHTVSDTYKDLNTIGNFYRFSFLIPGFSIETKIANSTSLNGEIGTGYSMGRNTDDGYNEIFIFYNKPSESKPAPGYNYKEDYTKIYPFLKLELRQFYNLLRRQNKNRRTKNNSADYFSLYSLIYFDDLYFIGPTWGIQRNAHRFYFNLNLGGGIYMWSSGSKFQPLLDLKLGIVINN